jgi:hypothetical protein
VAEPVVPAIEPSDFLARAYFPGSSEAPLALTIARIDLPTKNRVLGSTQIIIGKADTVTHGASVIRDSFDRGQKERKENRNLSKKRKRNINNNTFVKHWFPLSFYCLVLQ